MTKRDSETHEPHTPVDHATRGLGLGAHLGAALRNAWRPQPPPPPRLDRDVDTLPTIERVAEVTRFNVLALEQAISPNGGLRAWLKLNVLVALVLAIPAVLVVPVVTYLLGGFATWSVFLAQIAENLLRTAVMVFLIVLVIVVTGRVVRAQLAESKDKTGRGRGGA